MQEVGGSRDAAEVGAVDVLGDSGGARVLVKGRLRSARHRAELLGAVNEVVELERALVLEEGLDPSDGCPARARVLA
jgi:hypothetical protein